MLIYQGAPELTVLWRICKCLMKKYNRLIKLFIGTKQTLKAIKNGTVREVVVAEDADMRLTDGIIRTAARI